MLSETGGLTPPFGQFFQFTYCVYMLTRNAYNNAQNLHPIFIMITITNQLLLTSPTTQETIAFLYRVGTFCS